MIDKFLSRCVRRNYRFPGIANNTYTVQNFFDGTCTLQTIKGIANRLNKQLKELTTEDLFSGDKEQEKELAFKVETLKAIVEYKENLLQKAEMARITRESNQRKKQIIQQVLADKEISNLKRQSISQLESMLEDL